MASVSRYREHVGLLHVLPNLKELGALLLLFLRAKGSQRARVEIAGGLWGQRLQQLLCGLPVKRYSHHHNEPLSITTTQNKIAKLQKFILILFKK